MSEPGKLELFEQTIVPHLNAAYNLARWLMRDSGDAEDAVHEAYLRAFRFFDGFKGGDGRAWLLAVVRNTCLTWLGRRSAAAVSVEFDERKHRGEREPEGTEEALIRDAKLRALRNCIEALPVEYREVIVMREMEELPYREIAEAASLPVGTVMSRLARGRARLLECMGVR